jgi:hypothetical protein
MHLFPLTTSLSRYFFGIEDTKIGDYDQPFPQKTKKRKSRSIAFKIKKKRAYNKKYRMNKKSLQIST